VGWSVILTQLLVVGWLVILTQLLFMGWLVILTHLIIVGWLVILMQSLLAVGWLVILACLTIYMGWLMTLKTLLLSQDSSRLFKLICLFLFASLFPTFWWASQGAVLVEHHGILGHSQLRLLSGTQGCGKGQSRSNKVKQTYAIVGLFLLAPRQCKRCSPQAAPWLQLYRRLLKEESQQS